MAMGRSAAVARPVGISYSGENGPDAVAAGAFTGDGRLDLAVANFNNTGTVSILLGNGDGTFQPPVDYAVGSITSGEDGPVAIAVADFNNDGRLDLAVVNEEASTLLNPCWAMA